jgi:hypothetical protein
MDHLAKLYYNKYIDLQERYYQLMEDGADRLASMSESEFEDFIKANPGAEELARKKRAEGQARKTKGPKVSKTPKPQSESTWEERETRRRENRRAQREAEQAKPKTAPETGPKPPPGRAPRPSEAGFDDFIKQKAKEMRKQAQAQQNASAEAARQKAAAGYAEKQKAAERANPKPGSAAGKPTTKQATPAQQPAAAKPSVGQKAANMAKGFGKGAAGFGVGMLGYGVGRGISDTAMDVAGVENEIARDITGEAVGGAAGGVAGTATVSALGGALPTLTALGTSALRGGLAGVVGYGAYKAGEAISNIEVDDKGTTVSDLGGKYIYDIAGKMTGKGTSSEQLNTKATGVAGGDKAKMAQNAADEAEEEFQKKAEMEKRKAAIRARRAMEK